MCSLPGTFSSACAGNVGGEEYPECGSDKLLRVYTSMKVVDTVNVNIICTIILLFRLCILLIHNIKDSAYTYSYTYYTRIPFIHISFIFCHMSF